MIKINNLSLKFGSFTVFNNVNLHIKKGECISVIGPSGTGKSMLFRCIAMLERPSNGSIILNGCDITKKRG